MDDASVAIGVVTIQGEAHVWPGVVLRGDAGSIVLQEGANVRDIATVHGVAEIGPLATVGHNAIVHGATTGRRNMVGMGAVVLNGAKMSEESLVGAISLVTEDPTIPNGVLAAGTPADVIEEVEDSPWTQRWCALRETSTRTRRILSGVRSGGDRNSAGPVRTPYGELGTGSGQHGVALGQFTPGGTWRGPRQRRSGRRPLRPASRRRERPDHTRRQWSLREFHVCQDVRRYRTVVSPIPGE